MAKHSKARHMLTTRICRTCPRCRRRLYHQADADMQRGGFSRSGRNVVTATCLDCGYRWNPRFLWSEWEGREVTYGTSLQEMALGAKRGARG